VKLVSYLHEGGATFVGVLDAERGEVRPVDTAPVEQTGRDLLSVVRTWDAGGEALVGSPGHAVPLDSVRLRAPIPRPARNIFCVGKNYVEHADEFSRSGFDGSTGGAEATPPYPIVFTKPASSVIGPGEAIDPHEGLTSALDYEAEIAVIIGRGGRGISRDDALQHVWGYTLVNDVTARDLQAPAVVPRQVAGHLLPDGAMGGLRRRAERRRYGHRVPCQRRAAAAGEYPGPDLRHSYAHLHHLRGDQPRTR
jgi:2-keto-4-pentenoate hydratase/2-oxohepta-3-ene-1,7-dioic acid hydratase in catechol pathway